jgi:hypothetical protein
MTGSALHVAVKDVRRHRWWLVAFAVVTAARALVAGAGVDRLLSGRGALAWLGLSYTLLCILHIALLVTIAVQLVHADRLVGTTAFWLTRPIRRADLLLSKLGTAVAVLVFFPVCLDAFVVLANGLGTLAAIGTILDGLALRLPAVVAVMALAAVTPDLAVFLVTALATLTGATVVEVLLLAWRHPPSRTDLGTSMFVVFAVLAAAGALAALAHQFLTRRTARSVALFFFGWLLALTASTGVTAPIVDRPRALENGWLDPARVSATASLLPAVDRGERVPPERRWQLPARIDVSAAAGAVVLSPLAATTEVNPGPGAQAEGGRARAFTSLRSAVGEPADPHAIERAVGGTPLFDQPTPDGSATTATLAEFSDAHYQALHAGGGHLDVRLAVGATAYEACSPLALAPGTRGKCGGRSIDVLSALQTGSKCLVTVRDVDATFALDLRRPSRVIYALVNRARGLAAARGERDAYGRDPVFGAAPQALFGEHLLVTRRDLVFDIPVAAGEKIPQWLHEAAIVPVLIRDVGEFTVKATVR